MHHPLTTDLSRLKDVDLQNKITDASRKYNIAARMGNTDLCDQLAMILSDLKYEQSDRYRRAQSRVVNGVQLDKLIQRD